MKPYEIDADALELKANKIDVETIKRASEEMINNLPDHVSWTPKYVVLHPRELEEIEKKYGSFDEFWRRGSGGKQKSNKGTD